MCGCPPDVCRALAMCRVEGCLPCERAMCAGSIDACLPGNTLPPVVCRASGLCVRAVIDARLPGDSLLTASLLSGAAVCGQY